METANQRKIRHIACSVRGRLANRNAVQHAINLAVENDARLTFFMVISGDLLSSAVPTMSSSRTLFDRLREIGEYILLLLSDQAAQSGVSEVEHEIKIGEVRANLREFVTKTNAQILVMGRPTGNEPRSVFTQEEFAAFVQELEEVGNIQVEVIEPEHAA